MAVRRGMLAALSLLLLSGARDPFQPPQDSCLVGELPLWRYQGLVSRGERRIGLLQDTQHQWRRVEQNQVLKNGWRIAQLTAQSLTVETGHNCQPSQWQWPRQGKKDEAVDSGGTDRHDGPRTGGKSEKRDADSG
ncbi:TPA: HofP DNA utilization family protein [Citrobacter freundii]